MVTTPQEVALIDARKGVKMFEEVRVPVLGVVENMSYYVGPDGVRVNLFGAGGGRKLAAEAGVELLAELPIDPRVGECGDAGEPIARRHPDSPTGLAYAKLAEKVQTELLAKPAAVPLPAVEL